MVPIRFICFEPFSSGVTVLFSRDSDNDLPILNQRCLKCAPFPKGARLDLKIRPRMIVKSTLQRSFSFCGKMESHRRRFRAKKPLASRRVSSYSSASLSAGVGRGSLAGKDDEHDEESLDRSRRPREQQHPFSGTRHQIKSISENHGRFRLMLKE